ncbi:Hypothetical protein D9617_1g085730 [Elsinoe fawcettii]|nr:Hypothetical protein D9617_1g085730 [Elsinoe fawcettii]
MTSAQRGREYMFVHMDNASTRRGRDKPLDPSVRRHVMTDIGKTRRKKSKTLEYDTLVWQLQTDLPPQQGGPGAPASAGDVRQSTSAASHTLIACRSIDALAVEQALSMFERQWGEDMFSAYGFILFMNVGKNATLSSASCTNTFWFPFAFQQSAFLNHYQELLKTPQALISMYRSSAGKLKNLALQRSLETIQCVESRLASPDPDLATSNQVFHAVLAMICYNFMNLDFTQAMIHMNGLMVLTCARGGISVLVNDRDLLRMISWMDITVALLHDSRPLFPLAQDIADDSSEYSGLRMLPFPLRSIYAEAIDQDVRFIRIVSCIGDLTALSTLIRAEFDRTKASIWDDADRMASVTNPICYRLLSQKQTTTSMNAHDLISEALRIGGIIWLLRVKRRARSYPGTSAQRGSKLLSLLAQRPDSTEVWHSSDLRNIRLWLLVLCSLSEPSDGDLATAVHFILRDMNLLQLQSWGELMSVVRQMPWLDLDDNECAPLALRIASTPEWDQDRHGSTVRARVTTREGQQISNGPG